MICMKKFEQGLQVKTVRPRSWKLFPRCFPQGFPHTHAPKPQRKMAVRLALAR